MSNIKDIIKKFNEFGVPLPLLRIDGKASFTATMTFIAFNACLIGQSGKLAGYFGGIDQSQSVYLFIVCIGSYLGRKLQTKDVTITSHEEGKNESN